MEASSSIPPFTPAGGLIVAERYALVRELGRGAMGAIWQAHDQHLDAPCALKLLHPEHLRDAVLRQRFVDEARIAARLRSPYTIDVYDVTEWRERPFIAMELLDGEDLECRLERDNCLPPAVTCEIVRQVARGLEHAHRASLIHRDLKPENIYLLAGHPLQVKVLDFGAAKQLGSDTTTRTVFGAVIGTPQYMSPEQANGNLDLDYRSDLWALGVVVYRCLTGEPPFNGDSLSSMFEAIQSRPLPPLLLPGPAGDFPPALQAFWQRAAARDRTQRFDSALSLADGLQQALLQDGLLPKLSLTQHQPHGIQGGGLPEPLHSDQDTAPGHPATSSAIRSKVRLSPSQAPAPTPPPPARQSTFPAWSARHAGPANFPAASPLPPSDLTAGYHEDTNHGEDADLAAQLLRSRRRWRGPGTIGAVAALLGALVGFALAQPGSQATGHAAPQAPGLVPEAQSPSDLVPKAQSPSDLAPEAQANSGLASATQAAPAPKPNPPTSPTAPKARSTDATQPELDLSAAPARGPVPSHAPPTAQSEPSLVDELPQGVDPREAAPLASNAGPQQPARTRQRRPKPKRRSTQRAGVASAKSSTHKKTSGRSRSAGSRPSTSSTHKNPASTAQPTQTESTEGVDDRLGF